MTVTTLVGHGLSTSGKNSDVLLTGSGFTCALDNGAGIHTYPRANSVTNPHGGDPIFCGTPVVAIASATQFTINAGISTVPTFYVSGGIAQPVLIAPRANNNSASKQDPAFDGSTAVSYTHLTLPTIE